MQNNNVVLVLRYPPKNRILPPRDNLPPVWESLSLSSLFSWTTITDSQKLQWLIYRVATYTILVK